jgi:hypothetical protein
MTKQSDDLRDIVRTAKNLDAATATRVLVVIADIVESLEEKIKEFQQQARETNVVVQKTFIETSEKIQDLRVELAKVREERNQAELLAAKIAYEIANKRVASNLTTQQKIQIDGMVDKALKAEKAEVDKAIGVAISADKIDIRGYKIPSRFLPWFAVGLFIFSIIVLLVFPDIVAQILLRLAGSIGVKP